MLRGKWPLAVESAGANPCCMVLAGPIDFTPLQRPPFPITRHLHPLRLKDLGLDLPGTADMQASCSTTADSVAEVLFAGDVLLNLSSRTLPTCVGARQLIWSGSRLAIVSDQRESTPQSTAIAACEALREVLSSLRDDRLVIASETPGFDVTALARIAAEAGVNVVVCRIVDACEADAFMDEADSEAVMERLRQLGYV
jgi:hypothetical protein